MTQYILSQIEHCCYGCRACEKICPQKAIVMKPNVEGFLYPVFDQSSCVKCGLCARVCPHDNALDTAELPLKVYAAQHKNRDTLQKSSSGGVFSAVADYVLGAGGAVAGCIFGENFMPVHAVTEDAAVFGQMRGSKYVQSDTRDSFPDIRRRLERGQLVFFSGTPCQVHGLKRYLHRDYENLISADLICHGVPSPALFAGFLRDAGQKNGEITDIKFRDKTQGNWGTNGSMSCRRGETVKTRTISANNAGYYYYYLANCISRMCCYSCKYASVKRAGDITLGDYWGLREAPPGIDPAGGVSVVLANSERGEDLIGALRDSLYLYETELAPAVRGNGNLSKPCDMPESRRTVYRRIREQGYAAVAKADCKRRRFVPFLRRHTPKAARKLLKRLIR